jgi:hypothetical protein
MIPLSSADASYGDSSRSPTYSLPNNTSSFIDPVTARLSAFENRTVCVAGAT